MRRAAKVDDNQPEIVEAFRKLGYSVLLLHQVGRGCPDILVGKMGTNTLIEIKDGRKPPSRRLMTPDEEEFFQSWKGRLLTIMSVDEVIAFDRKHFRRSPI